MEPSSALPLAKKPPLDPRVLANVVLGYEGETLQPPHCDVPVYHGHGRLVFRTGFVYTGDFVLGRMHGRGRIEWSNGVVFEGEFVENEMNGKGRYVWPNGSSYCGDIVAGRRQGHGVFQTGNLGVSRLVDEHEGSGDSGALHASLANTESMETMPPPLDPLLRFTFHCQDEQAEQEMESGGSHETTNVSVQSNARYEGAWHDGLPHGDGVLVYDDARNVRYEGHFVRGKREGEGQMRYATGNLYSGEWESDVKRGYGVMKWMGPPFSSGDRRRHMDAEEDVLHEVYEGFWVDDCQHGFGRHVWLHTKQKEKNYYEGEFVHGLRHGIGVFHYANGARYEGEWEENVKEGHGVFFYEDGRVFDGAFHQDRCLEPSAAHSIESAGVTSTHASTSATASASSSARILLYIDELLPPEKEKREKAKKAVEHAALRLNTELRALYRQYMKDAIAAPSPSSDHDAAVQESGLLMEIFECRKLLSDCGIRISSGHLEQLIHEIRTAQRQSALASSPSSSTKSSTFVEALRVKNTLPNDDSSCANIVPHDQLLLYREFVEMLIRIAFWQKSQHGDALESGFSLADAFADMYERMVRDRLAAQHQSERWLGILRAQLHAKETQIIFKKHRVLLHQLFAECGGSSCRTKINQSAAAGEDERDIEQAPGHDDKTLAVSVRALLSMLRHVDTSGRFDIFGSPDFKLRDALTALDQVYSAPASPQKNGSDDEDGSDADPQSNKQSTAALDPFFIDTQLVYSEFLDALAIVIYVKQQKTPPSHQQTAESVTQPQQQHKEQQQLYVLLDRFLQSVKV